MTELVVITQALFGAVLKSREVTVFNFIDLSASERPSNGNPTQGRGVI